jgi:membrane protein implicated in regulation of membrane protease activity
MTVAFAQSAMSYRLLLLIPIAVAPGMILLIRAMRKLALRPQFMVLLVLGVSIGFIFLIMVQMPEFPQWLGVTLVVIVFIASLFGTRIFLRSLAQDEKEENDKIRAEDARNALDPKFPNMKPTKHTL